ncbi:NAD(P)-dependent oxidoreductase [Alkalilacustris brevis]|uniref:NAD(P)-dependent oxidoreductase n=1 Tax=Alkalilacustris brevis TaxID=2026338 RepID=UPI001390333A|nr:NAD(P)-dependent oxidoreductase [Alkalilacustris brevis]
MPAKLRAGVLGLGNMGRGIAATLDCAGLLAAAWDAAPAALASCPLSSGVARSGPRDVAGCDVILLAVPGSPEIAALFDRPDGPLSVTTPGRVMIDLTTSDPAKTRALAERAVGAGAAYLDAGMTGGAAAAENGQLTLMMGGEVAALERARPVLDAIAARVFHLGPVGAGHTMKLVHNMICHTTFLATAEGCRAAERAGIALKDAVDVLNAGNARSFVSERRFPDHVVSGRFDGRSHVGTLAKDLALAEALFAGLEQPACYVGLTTRLLQVARDGGLDGDDFTRLYPAFDDLVEALEDAQLSGQSGKSGDQPKRT